ncbi:bacteriohemerythrin [Thauera sp.]|uniref:bacteriohemerythrin n=1 Tax=Thauera sp. TaxID=1905334 RepID=UPI0039E554A7
MAEETAGFDWNDRYLLGHAAMDDTHREFVERVDALLRAPDAELEQALAAFADHAVAHFGEEDGWMKGSGFPAADCHIDEHAKVLESVREVQQALAGGNTEVVRGLAQALMDWFPGHADYMDSALALWMVKRSHGGAPLVFRRNSCKSDA